MKNRSELREIMMKILYQIFILEESEVEFDIESLKKINMLNNTVLLENNLVLPCKIKSENDKYKFNTEIIMTKDNVLGYASHSYEYDKKSNHNIMIHKMGNGLKNSNLVKKSKQATR